MERLEAIGGEPWFRLGDRDLATHMCRTERLLTGTRPTDVALELAGALGFEPRILPMADEPVRTEVRTDDGWLEFQEYFVHRHQEPTVHEVRFHGIEDAEATPEVIAAIGAAEVVVIAPSNPIVSIDPILALPGVATALMGARDRARPDRRGQRDHRREGAQGPGRPDARVARRRIQRGRGRGALHAAGQPFRDGHRRCLAPSGGRSPARPGARDRHDHDRRRRPRQARRRGAAVREAGFRRDDRRSSRSSRSARSTAPSRGSARSSTPRSGVT